MVELIPNIGLIEKMGTSLSTENFMNFKKYLKYAFNRRSI